MIPHPDQHFGCYTYSQNGEDLMVANLFKQLEIDKPSYIDIGAHHPFNISNTALLYSRGSRGINIEANPNLIREFYEQRTEDMNINVGIAPTPDTKTMTFIMYDPRSGRNTFSVEESERYVREHGAVVKDHMTLPMTTVNKLLEELGRNWPQFLSIDVEGLDFDILKNADFSKSWPLIICVEVRHVDEPDFVAMMRDKRFIPYCRCGENVIFVQEDVSKTLKKGWK